MFYMLMILMKCSFGPQIFFSIFFPALGWSLGLGTEFYFGIWYEKVRFYKLKIPATFGVVPQSFHQNQNQGSISRVTILVHNLQSKIIKENGSCAHRSINSIGISLLRGL